MFVGLHKHRVDVFFVSDQFDLVTLLRYGYKHIAVVRVTAERLPYGVAEAKVGEAHVGEALYINFLNFMFATKIRGKSSFRLDAYEYVPPFFLSIHLNWCNKKMLCVCTAFILGRVFIFS